METSELLKKVRQIEIKTRGLTKNIFAGEYHSAFKGKGMTFNDVREYQPGDDIRAIDWKLTARYQHPFVKLFTEERELTIILLVDLSASQAYGTRGQLKKQLIAEISAVLAFSAVQNNDKVGVIFFSDRIEKFIPPKKGKSHALKIIRDLVDFEPSSKGTDIKLAITYLTSLIKRRSIAFVISDFIAGDFEKEIKIASLKHDMVALQILDQSEVLLPKLGLVRMQDLESGQFFTIDSSSRKAREHWNLKWQEHQNKLKETFIKCDVDFVSIGTEESYVKPLMGLFKRHERLRR